MFDQVSDGALLRIRVEKVGYTFLKEAVPLGLEKGEEKGVYEA